MSYVADGGINAVDVTVTSTVNEVRLVSDYGINYQDITVSGSAYFTITGLQKPTKVNVNEQFTITVTILNGGGESGEVIVRLYENGNLVETRSITLNPNEYTSIVFERQAPSKPTTITYEIQLYNTVTDNIDDQVSFNIDVTTVTTTTITTNMALIGLIILIILLLLVFSRRKT